MAYASSTHTYTSGPRVFATNFAIGVLDADNILVQVNDEVDGVGNPVYRAFTFDASTGNVTLVAALVSGDVVKIKRVTPIEDFAVDFVAGANITRTNLQRSQSQTLFAVQELYDTNLNTLTTVLDTAERMDEALDTLADDLAAVAAARIDTELDANRAEAAAEVLGSIAGSAILGFDFGPFVSDGVSAVFTLPAAVYGNSQVTVVIDGATQAHDTYTSLGTVLTLDAVQPAGCRVWGKVDYNASIAGVNADQVLMAPSGTLAGIMPLTRSTYATDEAFDLAATARGEQYPTPYITKFDLPPQNLNIFHIGVIPSNLLADADNNVGAIQDVIDWLNSKTNGGRLVGSSFHPKYSNPIVALSAATAGPYAILLKPKVTLDMTGVRFRAAEAMETMVETVIDSAVDAANGRLKNISIYGGFWDAGRLANHCFRLREFEDINFGKNGMIIQSALRSPLRLGDSLRSKNSYGFYADHFKVANANSAYGGAAVAAIESVHGFSDSHFNSLLLEGYPRGITGDIYISRMSDCHAWSYADTQGPLYRGFNCSGGQNAYTRMQVDNPYEAAFYIDSGDNYRFDQCTSTMDLTAVTDPGKPASGTIPVFRINPAAAAGTSVLIDQGFGNDRAATTFSRMVSYPAGSDVTVRDSYLRYGSVEQEIVRGYPTVAVKITTIAGSNPTINKSQNIATVTRNGDADYTFTMLNGQPDTNYHISAVPKPTSYPQILNTIVRDQQASSFRLQFTDTAGAFIRPDTITVTTRKV